jgi:hypothetical protein
VSARDASRRVAAQESYQSTPESDQRDVKCAMTAKVVGTALHYIDGNTGVISSAKLQRVLSREAGVFW